MFSGNLNQAAEFKKYLAIQKERQLATQELSEILGMDVSLSDKEVLQYAQENFTKAFNKKISEDINSWMKSAFS